MSAIHYIARAWQSHAAATVGYEVDGLFYPIAECSGFGRSSEEAERTAAQIAAALNAYAEPQAPRTILRARNLNDAEQGE
jgi:hypothetical protein